MTFCAKCGAQLTENQPFCGSCGASVQPLGTNPGQTSAPVYQPAPPASPASDAQNNKAMGILSYLGILVLIPIFAAKESPYARFHANQGLVLAIAEIAYAIIYSILSGVLAAIMLNSISGLGLFGIIITILGLLSLVFVVLAIIGIVNAAKGEMKPLPIIGGIRILK